MKKTRGFDENERKKIAELIAQGKSNPEIAKLTGHTRAKVACFVQKFLGGNPNYIRKRTKHKHLREEVMTYFLSHSAEESAAHFKLTISEFRSLMTVGYQCPEFSHLRKETRRHDKFTSNELVTILKYSGILSRQMISEIIKRDGARVIKEKLAHLKIASRNINGMNLTLFQKTFRTEPPRSLKTLAGPEKGNGSHFRIALWVDIEEWMILGIIPSHPLMLKYVESMAMFQRWIWGTDRVAENISRALKKYSPGEQ